MPHSVKWDVTRGSALEDRFRHAFSPSRTERSVELDGLTTLHQQPTNQRCTAGKTVPSASLVRYYLKDTFASVLTTRAKDVHVTEKAKHSHRGQTALHTPHVLYVGSQS